MARTRKTTFTQKSNLNSSHSTVDELHENIAIASQEVVQILQEITASPSTEQRETIKNAKIDDKNISARQNNAHEWDMQDPSTVDISKQASQNSSNSQKVKCPECAIEMSLSYLPRHLIRKHNACSEKMRCTICSKWLSHAGLRIHVERRHKHAFRHAQLQAASQLSIPFCCRWCEAQFTQVSEYKTHLQTLHHELK